MKIHFLHGFMGTPLDWDLIKNDFDKFDCEFHSIDHYLNQSEKYNKSYFYEWATAFNNHVFKNSKEEKNVLIGYSLGGRLALHALIEESKKWQAAVIISANPGLSSEAEKKTRIESDKSWAHRFLNDDWHKLMNDWNAQSVFSQVKNTVLRCENNIDRKKLFDILINLSLGKQDNLREKIKGMETPILWLAGEKDKKFSLIADEMSLLNKNIKSHIVKNAGHRVPWENAEEFKKLSFCFLERI